MKFIDIPSFGFRWELCRGPKLLKLSCPSGLKRRSKWWRPDQEDRAKILRIFRFTSLLNNCTYQIDLERFLLEWVFEFIVWFFLFPGLVVLGPGDDCPIKQKFCYNVTSDSECSQIMKQSTVNADTSWKSFLKRSQLLFLCIRGMIWASLKVQIPIRRWGILFWKGWSWMKIYLTLRRYNSMSSLAMTSWMSTYSMSYKAEPVIERARLHAK